MSKSAKKTQEGIQVNKYISSSGFCSRREADKLIEEERVTINRKVALPTSRVNPGDVVAVDGEKIKLKTADKNFYIAFHKPVGITSTTDLQDKTNIISYINHPKRIFPIGRLDKDSEGLIFLTNDGDIVNKILREGNNHEKEYVVTVDKPITGEFLKKMASGVSIMGTKTKPCIVREAGDKRFKIILTQGLNRQIRRMCENMRYRVITLKRIRIMNISLGNLPAGAWRYLNQVEIDQLNGQLGESVNTPVESKKIKYT